MKYLTTQQYKNVDDGVIDAALTDLSLARIIARAERQVDSEMAFDPKIGGFEPHLVWMQGKFDYETLKVKTPNVLVPVRNIARYRIQVSNLTTSGAGFFANINNNDAVINNFGNYIEIVPLQAVTYSLAPVLVQLGLRPPILQVDAEVGYNMAVIGEQMIDDGGHFTYWATRGMWAQTYTVAQYIQPNTLPPIPPNVYVNGSPVTSGYTLDYVNGNVTFISQRLATDVVSIDYTFTIPDFATEATIYQTTFLLGQRLLNKAGMNGIFLAQSGDQNMRRLVETTTDPTGMLCKEARDVLRDFKPIGISGG